MLSQEIMKKIDYLRFYPLKTVIRIWRNERDPEVKLEIEKHLKENFYRDCLPKELR